MQYTEDRIPDPLSPVECVWEFRGTGDEPQRISTDARAEIILQLAAPMEQWDGSSWRLQPACIIAGQITHPLMIRATGETHTVGIRLKAWATTVACQADAAAITDQLLDLGDISGRFALRCQAVATSTRAERVGSAAALFALRAPAIMDPRERIRAAVALAETRSGDIRVTELARASHMSLRSFERHLSAAVGVGPKMLLRMLRFRTAVKMVEAERPLAEIAARLGYSDQSHLHKDFLRFAGAPPSLFLSPETAMAAHFYREV